MSNQEASGEVPTTINVSGQGTQVGAGGTLIKEFFHEGTLSALPDAAYKIARKAVELKWADACHIRGPSHFRTRMH
jgi:hypothetical protein